ncbi:MAG: CDP-alcohol phosphatidyltransferase family protein [Nocardiopsaceae bacterium]|nr:CDP-alcohol phosphatidyltransferase family protein [Nocardiopsaceae bacterium]
MSVFTLSDVREQTYKPRDSWWTVYLVDPLASRLVQVTANRTSLTPNQLTLAALVLGLGAAGCFAMAEWPWLLAGALLFHFSFVLDCMDGKIARLKGNGSIFGSWLDYVFDRLRVLVCAVALMGGQYALTGEQVFAWCTLGIVFTDMFRYLNSPQMAKVRVGMRKRLTRAIREAGEAAYGDGEEVGSAAGAHERLNADLGGRRVEDAAVYLRAELDDDEFGEDTAQDPRLRAREVQATELQRSFNSRFPWYARFRDTLREHRVRPHLFSGIEFQMGCFIVAPVVGAFSTTGMLLVIGVSAMLMMAFELLLVYKLWLSTKEFSRVLAGIEETAPHGGHGVPQAADAETDERADTEVVAAPRAN